MNSTDNLPLPVGYADVAAAATILEGIAHCMPALTSRRWARRSDPFYIFG